MFRSACSAIEMMLCAMLTRLGLLLFDHRRLVIIISSLILVTAIVVMVRIGGTFSSEGFVDETSESARVDQFLATEFRRGASNLIVLFDAAGPIDETVRRDVEAALAPLMSDPGVVGVLTPWKTGNPNMISTNGDSVYTVVVLNDEGEEMASELVASVHSDSLAISTTGASRVGDEIPHEVEKSLIRAEMISTPITILL